MVQYIVAQTNIRILCQNFPHEFPVQGAVRAAELQLLVYYLIDAVESYFALTNVVEHQRSLPLVKNLSVVTAFRPVLWRTATDRPCENGEVLFLLENKLLKHF